MRLEYSDVLTTYQVVEPLRLPYHSGSLLRGVLGRALRRAACAAASPCTATCEAPAACAYARLFDPPVPEPLPHKLLRGATQAPPPLLPQIPAPGVVELEPGSSFVLGLRVLGRLGELDEQRLRRALELVGEAELGRDRGRLRLGAIDVVRHSSPASFDGRSRRALVTFETPAWIEHRGQLLTSPDFRTLFRDFNRRLTIVSTLYGDHTAADDERFSELDALSETISTRAELIPLIWERHSVERGQRHPMKGVLGTIELEGELGPFVELLRLAEIAHVGKATSYGLGRVRVTFS